ncbi:MAG: AmmeMemoRadiSam system radical SAM enzyme [Acutalibacteraceae bacterium]|jgi:pyruvate formate lyase activating enzyme
MSEILEFLPEAMFYRKTEDDSVICELCPHGCIIQPGKTGVCGTRKNIGGKLYPLGWQRISALNLDPIEKKPLSMFSPGYNILSIGGYGCNLRCPFCQNHDISVFELNEPNEETFSDSNLWPKGDYFNSALLECALENCRSMKNIGVAYTYNEPLINYEFVYHCAEFVSSKKQLKNVPVTNGYINPEPLLKLLPLVDAMNIDLKGFTDEFYKKLGGRLNPVKNTIEMAAKHCHIEVSTLIIPGENDSEEEIALLAEWLSGINPGIPLHLNRFFPRYKYSDKSPTPRERIFTLYAAAKRYLKNVFMGNM